MSILECGVNVDGYVYVLRAGAYFKIGRSRYPDRRIKRLKIQLPFPVEVYALIPCEDHIASEKLAHDSFPDLRANGEWFLIWDEAQIAWMKDVTSPLCGCGEPDWVSSERPLGVCYYCSGCTS